MIRRSYGVEAVAARSSRRFFFNAQLEIKQH